MSVMERIVQRAKADKKRIVLAEGSEPRTVKAAEMILRQGIADLVLVGREEDILSQGADIAGAEIVDPAKSDKLEEYANLFYELRKSKGLTLQEARETLLTNTLYFATIMLKAGDVDAMVAGAINSTSNVIRPALQIIKPAKGISCVSSCFIMDCPTRQYGENGVFVYGDCGLVIDPNTDELAAIAIATANTSKVLTEFEEPRVAMLSFSTKGSAKHAMVDKVTQALEKAREIAPDLLIDGELQVDAALVPGVAELKAPGSPVAGRANVLIFPDIDSGNIAYKITQRLGQAEAYGPLIQGLAKPVNDLSRGCVPEDIVCVVAVTAVQAQNT